MDTRRAIGRSDRVDGRGALTVWTGLVERRGGWWRLVAAAEVALAVVAVLADWFIPASCWW